MKTLFVIMSFVMSMSAMASTFCYVVEHRYTQDRKGNWHLTTAGGTDWDVEAGVDSNSELECVYRYDELKNKGFCYGVIARNGNFYWYTKTGNRGAFGSFDEQPVPQDKYLAWLKEDRLTAVIVEGKMKSVLQVANCR